MSHVTPYSRSEEILDDGESKINHFEEVPEDRTAVDNILRVNHGNQMRLGLMADAKANIMITVASIVFSITIANLDNEVMKWPLLTFAIGSFFALLFAIFAIIPNTDYPKVKGTKEIDRKIFNSCDHKWVPEIGQICHGASERNYYCLKCKMTKFLWASGAKNIFCITLNFYRTRYTSCHTQTTARIE